MTAARVRPVWGLAEVAALASVFAFGLWIIGPRIAAGEPAQGFYWVSVIAGGAVMFWLSPMVLHGDPPGLRGWGLGRDGADPGALRNAWAAYLIPTLLAAAALVVGTAVRNPDFLSHIHWTALWTKLCFYVVFAQIQAMVFFGYVQTRVRTFLEGADAGPGLKRGAVVLGTACIFAAAHWPNLPLVALAFPAGLVWAWLFYVRPSVVLVGLSQAVLGTIVHSVAHLSMRIGPFYEHPEAHLLTTVIPGLKALAGSIY